MNMLKIVVLVLVLHSVSCSDEDRPFVQTSLGGVRGSIKTSVKGRKFAAFEGIPYAKPPVGEQRFKVPEQVAPWGGTWDATHPTECLQHLHEIKGEEDCLHINVYVPRPNPDLEEDLEVIVHIHGGTYMVLSGHRYAHPEVLMDQNIIFVTFNYRLGILGFLSTEDEVLPGNNGLKDQVMALEWIQKHIESFGGDPDSVTLTGLSAGAASVHLHYLSEMSEGLFHRGFSISGVALNPWSLQDGAAQKARMLGKAVGCPTSNSKQLVECLKQRPERHLLEKTTLFYGHSLLPIAPFGPVVERGPKPFLKAHPYKLLSEGKVLDVPWILSTTSHEGFWIQNLSGEKIDLDGEWEQLAPFILDFNYTLDKASWSSASKKIRQHYFGDGKIDKIESIIRMFGDRNFVVDAEKAVRLQAKATDSPVYYYVLSYPGEGENKFVGHGDDIKYFFGPAPLPLETNPKPLTDNELKMRDILIEVLISYAKTGTPIIDGVDWSSMDDDKLSYLDISSFNRESINMKSVGEFSALKFWSSLGFLENENLLSVPKDEL